MARPKPWSQAAYMRWLGSQDIDEALIDRMLAAGELEHAADLEHYMSERAPRKERTGQRTSPMSWVGPDAPPFMVVHGANDTLVPVEQARTDQPAQRERRPVQLDESSPRMQRR
mgnify:CR=1 FL=1